MDGLEDRARRAIAELLALYDEVDAPTYPMELAVSNQADIAHGWYQRTRRTTQAALLLYDQGFGNEAAPLRRCALEHALAVMALAQHGAELVKKVKAEAQKGQRNSLGHILANDPGADTSQIDLFLAQQFPQNRGLPSLKAKSLLDDFQPDAWLAYIHDSERIHPRWAGAADYLGPEEGGHAVTPNPSRTPPVQVLVPALYLASKSFSTMLKDDPWRGRVDTIVAT